MKIILEKYFGDTIGLGKKPLDLVLILVLIGSHFSLVLASILKWFILY